MLAGQRLKTPRQKDCFMTDILSQDEIDQLLNAISSGEVYPEDDDAPPQPRVRIYDFKRPDKFSREQLENIKAIHENFSRIVQSKITAKIKNTFVMMVTSVDQLTYEEFIRSIPNPTLLAAVSAPPLESSFLIEIDPAITHSLVDSALGGAAEYVKLVHSPSKIDQKIMTGLIDIMLEELQKAWQKIASVHMELKKVKSNPQTFNIVEQNEMVMLVTLEAKSGEYEGMVNICLPLSFLEPLLPRLDARSALSGSPESSLEATEKFKKNIKIKHYHELSAPHPELTFEKISKMQSKDLLNISPEALSSPFFSLPDHKENQHDQ